MSSVSATRCVAPLPKTFVALKKAIASTTYQSATEASGALGYLLNSSSPIFSANLGDLIDRDLCDVGHHFENKFRVQTSFPALDAAVTGWGRHKNLNGHEMFVTKLLPSICEHACRYPDLIPKGMIDTVGPNLPSDSPNRLRKFTKDQLHCLLSNAFLCTFRRLSNNCASLALQLSEDADENINIHAVQCPMPSCNYDELLAGPPDNVHVSKLEMILCYFDTMMIRSEEQRKRKSKKSYEEGVPVPTGSSTTTTTATADASSSPVTLIIARGKADPYVRLADPTHPNTKSNMPLLPVTMHPLRHSIDDLRDAIRVDFANKIIGGAVSYGNVQEEITFALCPELHVSRIMFECMAVDEAIVLVGAEQFALLKPGTYGGSMQCAGYPPNQSAELSSSKTSVIVAVDALDFRHHRAMRQFSCEGFEREINKLAAGLKFPIAEFIVELQNGSPPTTASNNAENQQQQPASPQGFRSNVVATGNWGCGVFRGDVMLKTVLQWLCCSLYGKEMHYFPFDREDIFEMGTLMNALIQQRGSGVATVADLEGFLAVLEESMRGGEGEGKRSRDHQQPPTRRFIIELFKSHFKLKSVSSKE